jgi:fructoselysine-6-P-deglycase FrlB-like protein
VSRTRAGTAATNAALEAAKAAGARTAIITVTGRSPGAALADVVVETGELDQSWCHTVGYLSPLVAATAVGAHLTGRAVDGEFREAVRSLVAAGVDRANVTEAAAGRLAERGSIVVIASGADRTAGRELTLKIEEGTWIPAAYRDLETFLHGHLAATDDAQGLVLILSDREAREARLQRATGALRAARTIGMEAAAILTAEAAADLPTELTPAGRIVIPEAPSLPSPVAALLGTAEPAPTADGADRPRARRRPGFRSIGTSTATARPPTPPRADRPGTSLGQDRAMISSPMTSTMSRSQGMKSWNMIRSMPASANRCTWARA